ncbi:hypothetical protein V1512DRAFT_257793 [Lipomyces arxii]|uniref:uncharacterized protein n=1 Tax=Lipomyces arxii TaxID=56418 RepID=UPI0034CD3579
MRILLGFAVLNSLLRCFAVNVPVNVPVNEALTTSTISRSASKTVSIDSVVTVMILGEKSATTSIESVDLKSIDLKPRAALEPENPLVKPITDAPEPVVLEPVKSEPILERVKAEPILEPVKAEPVKSEPVKVVPVKVPVEAPPEPEKKKKISIPVVLGSGYHPKKRQGVPLFCMRREIDNGEHVTDPDTDLLVYDPFPVMCKETKLPLSFTYGVDSDGVVNCTFTVLDETYHLLQLYVHQDSPLSCHVPARYGSSNLFAPLVFSMQGELEHSHLDIATKFNLYFSYAEPDASSSTTGQNITSAVAYPTTPHDTTRLIIGDDLTLQFNVRWFPLSRTPKQVDRSMSSFVTFLYCAASAFAAFWVAAFYFLAIVFPARVRARSARQNKFGADFSMFGGSPFTSSTTLTSSKRD